MHLLVSVGTSNVFLNVLLNFYARVVGWEGGNIEVEPKTGFETV